MTRDRRRTSSTRIRRPFLFFALLVALMPTFASASGPSTRFGPPPRSDRDFQSLRRQGVRRIVDLRTGRRLAGRIEARRAAAYGIQYERLPVGFYPLRRGNLAAILSRTAQPDTYIHCHLGRDRAAMVVAIDRVRRLGWSPRAAWDVWKSGQFNRSLRGLDRAFAAWTRPVGRQ